MKGPSFFHGVVVAAVLGFSGSAFLAALTPFVGMDSVVRLMIPALGLAYLLYLLGRSADRTGRIVTLTIWAGVTAVTWWMAPPLPFYLLIHVAAVWLVRSLYFYSGIVPALIDLGLSGLSVSASIWAISRSGSVFLAIWCFFLVQALFVAIPAVMQRRQSGKSPVPVSSDNFEKARRRADAAIRQLITQP
jgi:hypothetical protein